MRRQLTIAVLLGIAPIIRFAQLSSHKLFDYAGTWQANFEGKQFMTIKLVEKDGQMTGSVSCGDINGTKRRIWRFRKEDLDAALMSSPTIGSEPLSRGIV